MIIHELDKLNIHLPYNTYGGPLQLEVGKEFYIGYNTCYVNDLYLEKSEQGKRAIIDLCVNGHYVTLSDIDLVRIIESGSGFPQHHLDSRYLDDDEYLEEYED